MSFLSDINVSRPAGSNGQWTLLAPLIYKGNTQTFTIPKGFRTDFASIPPIFFTLFPKNGRYDAAAIVHDWLYVTQPVSRKDADGIFRKIMKELGVGFFRRRIMYYAVRVGGAFAWNKNRKR